jgi:hypothetical protein
LDFVIGQVLAEGPSLRSARRTILQEIADATKIYGKEIDRLRPVADGLTADDLRRYTTFDAERRRSVDDKARANLVSITVGFTVLLVGLNVVGKSELKAPMEGWWGILFLALFMLGVVYLMYGGLKALEALQIAKVFSPSAADESGVCEAVRRVNLLWCLQQNERTSILRTNAVSVSHRSIRNGVVSLAVLILLMGGRILLFICGS